MKLDTRIEISDKTCQNIDSPPKHATQGNRVENAIIPKKAKSIFKRVTVVQKMPSFQQLTKKWFAHTGMKD